ncbi:MAG: ribosome assembly factor SBDS [Candidatus Pacearchaeota archaeon]|nr:ribosome assembly factor SBDS [Candidatus Pacearchaeota archaeon]
MANVEARIKVKGKHYEISVDLDEALKVKKMTGDVSSALNSNGIYYDLKKGTIASQEDLKDAFGTTDLYAVAKKIMEDGEIQKTQEYRDEEREKRIKQVLALVLRNAVDQHGKPFSEERIRRAIDDVHYSFDKRPAEQQMIDLVEKLKEVIPIRVETKKIKLIIPARFSGQAYGLLKDYKQKEEWLSNGDLEVIINIPAGLQMDFYERLNNITHGSVISEEVSE